MIRVFGGARGRARLDRRPERGDQLLDVIEHEA